MMSTVLERAASPPTSRGIATRQRLSQVAFALACLIGLCAQPPTAQAQDGYAAGMKAGRAAYNQNDMATAERHFEAAEKAAENNRQKGSALYALGVVSQKQNKLPEAKKHAEQALALNPDDKQAKGLLDEVNAAPPAKGAAKAKTATPKGLAKTPLSPPTRKAAAKTDPAKPATDGATPAAVPATSAADAGQAPPLPKAAKPKPAAVPAKTTKPAAKPAVDKPATDGPAAPIVAPVAPGKSGALPPDAVTPTKTVDAGPSASRPRAAVVLQAPAPPVEPAGVAETLPALAPTPAVTAPAAQATAALAEAAAPAVSTSAAAPAMVPAGPLPLPKIARYVEMTCGVDYRGDDRYVARAYEITRGSAGTKSAAAGDILAFELTCEKAARSAPVPRGLITPDKGGEIVRTELRMATEGGWTYSPHNDGRAVRIRLDAETLTIVPTAAEVAVLRQKLAENPAQLETMAPEARQKFELAVTGEGYPEFRAVQATDSLDAAFDKAAKLAKRLDSAIPGAQASTTPRGL